MFKDLGGKLVDQLRDYASNIGTYGTAGEAVDARPLSGFDDGAPDLSDWGPTRPVGGFGELAPDLSEFFEPAPGPTGPAGGFLPPGLGPEVYTLAQGHYAD